MKTLGEILFGVKKICNFFETIHMEECYSRYKVFLPETERITKNTVLLSLYPSMTIEEQKYVIESVKGILH